jgi:hypothetical protein
MLADPIILAVYIVVNLIALTMTLLAWKRPNRGRLLFSLNFLGAALFNSYFLFSDPEEFVYYADFAVLKPYRQFIIGTFAEHIGLILGMVVIGQLAVALALASRGQLVKLGALGGVIFLVAIAPLGLGAFFPSTLVLALGCFFLYYKNEFTESLLQVGRRWRRG